ncbi:protein ARV1-like isoform X4 [Daphnia magna]|uniref:protein ARV1-like isoform X4 n=1 Tax=Daphnia magna TaxID=35525 RepID=UPI001E1BCD58|nr:protein ARV1-like isoform X4 [Daphnia magna]
MNTKFYSCIECGAKNVALFQVFSENALTLQTCANCSKVIDKYVEYDFTVILIDILLLKFSAYRHVLYNSNTKTHLSRLLALTLLSSSYVEWVYQKGQIQQRSEFILYELEWSFYIMIGQELISKSCFVFFYIHVTWIHVFNDECLPGNIFLDTHALWDGNELLLTKTVGGKKKTTAVSNHIIYIGSMEKWFQKIWMTFWILIRKRKTKEKKKKKRKKKKKKKKVTKKETMIRNQLTAMQISQNNKFKIKLLFLLCNNLQFIDPV